MRLDRSLPFSEVIGLPGVTYEQHGRRFNAGGREVVVRWLPGGETEVREALDDDEPPPLDPGSADNYRAMHWKTLKALCDTYGHAWKDKEDAVRFLEGNIL